MQYPAAGEVLEKMRESENHGQLPAVLIAEPQWAGLEKKAEAMREIKGLDCRPSGEVQLEIAEHWRPWRAIAARIHWHHYLSGSS